MKKDILLLACILALIAQTLWILSKKIPSSPSQVSDPKLKSLCMLFGEMRKGSQPIQTGVGALGNLIHLSFDAETFEGCRSMTQIYCKESLHEGYVSNNLTVVFRPRSESAESQRFKIDPKCDAEGP